jgi:serine/threonine protein kinase
MVPTIRRLVKPGGFILSRCPMPHPQTIGPYQIIEEIGRGGFAVVYRARHSVWAVRWH